MSNVYDLWMDDSETNESFTPPERAEEAIELLTPGSKQHEFVLNYLVKRIKASEDKMNKFYSRWQIAERKFQAYMSLPNYEQMLKDMNNSSKPPAPAIILFPYKYAVISTIVTYCMRVFTSSKPFLKLGAYSQEAADNVRFMESMLQYQCDMSKMVMRMFQLFLDGELYGVAAVRLLWKTVKGKRNVLRPPNETEMFAMVGAGQQPPSMIRDRVEKLVYAGTEVTNIDPFMFFPDPNVPMNEVSAKGEFVFWRDFMGKHALLKAQAAGEVKYADTVEPYGGNAYDTRWFNYSNRSAITQGDSHAGAGQRGQYQLNNVYMVDQGSVEIVPSELGLGPETSPQKWLFTIVNKKQIIQAEPLDLDHGRHPVEVSEPYSMGYGFGQPSMSDYAGPLQDILSWFIDSHIYNVRSSLNNQWLFDPSRIDENSLKYKQPGKHIKVKPIAYGSDVRTAITQFPVTDVTRNHMSDITAFMQIGDMVSSVNDPMRGVQPSNSRQTATTTRITTDAAGARLGEHAKFISQQAVAPMTEQMVLNVQQLQDEAQWIKVIGEKQFAQVGRALLEGDYTYPIQDGSLPLDRIGSFDLWKEILTGMAQSPLLQQTHSLPRIFEFVCGLGGAQNISSFRLVPDAQMDALAKQGNVIPMPQAQPPGGPRPPQMQ